MGIEEDRIAQDLGELLLKTKSLIFGDKIETSEGQECIPLENGFKIDLTSILFNGEYSSRLAKVYVDKIIKDLNGKVAFDYIHGPAYSGISITAPVVHELSKYGLKKRYGFRGHGKMIGEVCENDEVLILDDALCSGKTIYREWQNLKDHTKGLKLKAVLVGIDCMFKKDGEFVSDIIAKELNTKVISVASIESFANYFENRFINGGRDSVYIKSDDLIPFKLYIEKINSKKVA